MPILLVCVCGYACLLHSIHDSVHFPISHITQILPSPTKQHYGFSVQPNIWWLVVHGEKHRNISQKKENCHCALFLCPEIFFKSDGKKADPFTSQCWIDNSKSKCLLHSLKKRTLPISTRTMAFTLECSFCGTVGTLSSHPRTSTPACRPLPARLGDIEARRRVHPGSWHTLYSSKSPGRMQKKAGDVYNSLEERRRLCKQHCLIVITSQRASLRCKCLENKILGCLRSELLMRCACHYVH